MNAREFKNSIYSELVTITKALASPQRLEIIELLAQGPNSVEYIAEQTELSIANASHHLQVLKKARLAKAEKRGKYSYYSLANQKIYAVWKSMRELGFSQNAEIKQLVHDFRYARQSLESISLDELQRRIKNDEVLLLDVRPGEEYEEGHIVDAVSLPGTDLENRMNELPNDKEIIAYCRGPLCTMADKAVEMLRKNGFRTRRLEVGYPEWMLQNSASEQGPEMVR